MRAHTFLSLILFACAFFTMATPARAQGIDQAGASRLKILLEEYLAQQKQMNDSFGQTVYNIEGAVAVTPREGFYAAQLPRVTYTYPDGNILDVGRITLNAAPHERPGQWKMSIALPAALTLRQADGTKAYVISLGTQSIQGIWDESLRNFAQLKAEIGGISGVDGKGEASLKIGHAVVNYNLKDDTQKLWTGGGRLDLEDVSLNVPARQAIYKLARGGVDFSVTRYNPAVMQTLRKQMMALAQGAAAAPQKPTAAHAQAMYKMMTDMMVKAASGYQITYHIESLIGQAPAQGAAPALDLKIHNAMAGISLGGLDTPAMNAQIMLAFDGLKNSGQPESQQAVMPEALQTQISLQNVPLQEILTAGSTALQAASVNPQMASLGWMTMTLSLPGMLAQAGTQASLLTSYAQGPGYRVEGSATARADGKALSGFTAEGQSVFTGLDDLIARLSALRSSSASPVEVARLNQAIKGLETYRAQASVGKTASGQTQHRIDMRMGADGTVTLNGKPWSPIK